jgi:diacylglycerol kinase (ATP)
MIDDPGREEEPSINEDIPIENHLSDTFLEQIQEKPKYARVIINPAAGRDQPVLKTLNAAFRSAGTDWDVSITKKSGDGTRLAKEAVEAGADVVVVHGGDGTVMEVASGLMGTRIPMAIVPGGTANVMSRELAIPSDLVEASTLIVSREAWVRRVDMGKVGSHYFLLRAGMGLEAAMIEAADRDLKDRLGLLAYAFTALQELASPQIATYHLMLDGQEAQAEGLACIVANSGNIGAAGISIVPDMDVSDGLLDVIVITRGDLPSLVALAASVVGGVENAPALQHWRVKKGSIRSDPPQSVQVDGEILEKTPVDVEVVPHAVRILVPPIITP